MIFVTEQEIKEIEDWLGYDFSNKALLVQAFTRSSFEKNDHENDSEVLEFLGDRVIEYFTTKLFFDSVFFPNNFGVKTGLTEGDFTTLKAMLVENDNLASIIKGFGVEKYLRIGKNDVLQDSYRSDLLESIVGAIAVDSFFEERILYDVVDYLIMPRYYISSSGFKDFLEFEKWRKIKKPRDFKKTHRIIAKEGKEEYETELLFGKYRILGTGETKIDSVFKASGIAIREIEKNKENITPKDFLKDLDENNVEECLKKLKHLGYFSNLSVEEKQGPDNIWRVTTNIGCVSILSSHKNKSIARKIGALLCINSLVTGTSEVDLDIRPFLAKLEAYVPKKTSG